MTRTRALLITASLTLAACGGSAAVDTTATTAPTTTPTTTTADDGPPPAAPGGWIDGEPSFSGAESYSEGGSGDADTAYSSAPMAPADATGAVGDIKVPSEVQGALRAGSIDDNEDLDGFLRYLQRLDKAGIVTRGMDPIGRIIVTVTGSSGRPVAGTEVTFTADGEVVATVRTTADGTARFLPAMYGAADASTFEITSGDANATASAGDAVTLSPDVAGGAEGAVKLDVVFLLDATGSMGDEIDRLKTSIDSIATRVAGFDSEPQVRFGMTLYRDLEDRFVTANYDLTSDVDAFRTELAKVQAGGGGDYAEALDEGLADAIAKQSWGDPADTIQLVFLVADAPPQVAREVQTPYTQSIVDAVSRGIKIFPIASSESDDQAEAVFRQLAMATGARFVFLSYGAGGTATGANTDIDSTDYEEMSLDDLVVRFIGEELAALTGDDAPPPPTTVPDTSVPDGQ